VYVEHDDGGSRGKSAFLWREHFSSGDGATLEKGRTTARKGCSALARAVYAAKLLAEQTEKDSDELFEYYKGQMGSDAANTVPVTALENVAGQYGQHTQRQESLYTTLLDLSNPTTENSNETSLGDCLFTHFLSDESEGEDGRAWTVTTKVIESIYEIEKREDSPNTVDVIVKLKKERGTAGAILNYDGKPYCVIVASVTFEKGCEYCSILGQEHDIPALLLVMIHIGTKDAVNFVDKLKVFLVHVKHTKADDISGKSTSLWSEDFSSCTAAVSEVYSALARAVHATKVLAELPPKASDWIPLGDNCARKLVPKTDSAAEYSYMYKIFDNRFTQTYRSPDVWLLSVEFAPWLKKLEVETFLED
jgi:hypothetical protein